jgi:O-antigen ligase
MSKIILSGLLIFIIIFSCLARGAVALFPLAIIEITAGLIISYWLIEMIIKKRLSFIKTDFLIPLALFFGLIFFQLLPLPSGLLKIISPKTAALYAYLMPQGVAKNFFSLSIYPYATILELFKMVTYLGIFVFIINKIETKGQCDLILNTIIALGTCISIFAFIQKYAALAQQATSGASGYGPFFNRNNFAGYINMVIPLALGYFLYEKSLNKKTVYGFCIAIMSLALFLSLSRAGILVYIFGLIFILLFSRTKGALKEKSGILTIWIVVIILSFLFFIDTKIVWEALASLFKKETMVILGHGYSWGDIVRIWKDFPVFGTGLGTFANMSGMYKSTVDQNLFVYAHNDCLQLLSETGLLGGFLIFLFFMQYFRSLFKVWSKRHDTYAVCMVFGATASLFVMSAYSFLDFNLHIPANALLFFVIMGLACRIAFTQFMQNNELHPDLA